MKKTLLILLLTVLVVITCIYVKQKYYNPRHRLEEARKDVNTRVSKKQIQNGDLIFQTSLSGQSLAIQMATHSPYSHCGIIFQEGNAFYVFEAVEPVKKTPLDQWIARGKDAKYVVKRLKQADKVLTPQVLNSMEKLGKTYSGKHYDLTFEWSDNKMYCSELIWKLYQRTTGIEIGKPEQLKDFDLSHEAVIKKMKERYGNNLPLTETVISPVAIFNSEQLVTVYSHE